MRADIVAAFEQPAHVPPPVALVPPAMVRLMRPVGDPCPKEVLTEAELAARVRAEQGADGLTPAQCE